MEKGLKMIETTDLEIPERALAIVAHPDDAEFQSGATLAKWSRLDSEVHHLVLTDGSKGTWDPEADELRLIEQRKDEQRAAASALGCTGTIQFLGMVDGELEVGREQIAAVARIIRGIRPDVIVGHDPWKRYRLHPDHRRAGELCVEAIVAARDPKFFPEQLADGLEPHRPRSLLLFEADEPNHAEEVLESDLQRRIAALESFTSQMQTTHFYNLDEAGTSDASRNSQLERFRQGERDGLVAGGEQAGVAFAELFRLISDQL